AKRASVALGCLRAARQVQPGRHVVYRPVIDQDRASWQGVRAGGRERIGDGGFRGWGRGGVAGIARLERVRGAHARDRLVSPAVPLQRGGGGTARAPRGL